MAREYGQYGYEQFREGRRSPNRDSEYYGGGDAPLEWDDRRYGRDFDDYPRQGGRSVYAGSGRSQRYGSEGEGSSSGRSNYGSSRYGGSDYENNDYSRNESRYGSPYESSNRRFGSQRSETGHGDQEIVGSNWERSRGSGEWSTDRNRSGGQTNYGQSSSNYENYGQGYDDYYGREATGRQSSGQSSGQSYGGQNYGSQGTYGQEPYQAQSYQGQSYRGQSHRGKGPKGYERSEERIKEMVCEALTDAPHIDASDISVEVKNKEVKLTGTVNDRRTKYAAEELVESRAGNCEIRNELRVKNASESSRSGQYGASMQTSDALSSSGGQSGTHVGTQSGKQDTLGKGESSRTEKYGKNS